MIRDEVLPRYANTHTESSGIGPQTTRLREDARHRYVADPEHREEGGTLAIIESIRAGLVFALKQAVGVPAIKAAEDRFLRAAVREWQAHPNIEILGNLEAERLSIVSFVVRRPGRSPGTWSTRWSSWPSMAGCCCRTTGSTRRPGLWRHRFGLVEPPLRLNELRYDDDGGLRGHARRRSDFGALRGAALVRASRGVPARGVRRRRPARQRFAIR